MTLFSRLFCAFALLNLLAACWGDEVGLPKGVTNSQDPRDIPSSPAEGRARITVPEGFQVSLFAAEPHVQQPIAFDFDDRGRLWVVECFSHPKWQATGHDRVIILEDSDHDGCFDKRTVFWNSGRYLSGIAVGHGGVFLCNTPELIFVADRDRNDIPDRAPEVLLDGWDIQSGPNNVINNLRFGPDGWLYGSIGQNRESVVGAPGTPETARRRISRGLWRYHPIRRQFEVVALGAVNPWGLDFNEVGDGFFTNCVLPHCWQLIPGAFYQRRPGEKDNPYAYGRIQPICDHRHWATGAWTDSRGGHGDHGAAGGGHAHTGAMIYLGNNWPDEYRNTFFTGNIHGNRINNDVLWRKGSSYVASHRDDFLFGNDPWFRCLSQKVGPDGSVFITDWHDVGECHDSDGSHRSSGRVYRVSFGTPPPPEFTDLQALTDEQLIELQRERNDWFVRRARRILQERAASGQEMDTTRTQLTALFHSTSNVPLKLRYLWALSVTNGTTTEFLTACLTDESEYVRSWAIRLLIDRGTPPRNVQEAMSQLAKQEPSAYVRLWIAVALPRLTDEYRWRVAVALAGHRVDAEDAMLPLMIWYGIEPLVPLDPDRSLLLIRKSQIPLIQQYVARRLAESL